ncbi:MAG: TonB-dependent copper receptor [Opitutaceae bacterium]|jgi:iron complex outermembrane receptor protein|nr:TonB-dependent copper receptor [Opitutaceae bacterium]
MKTISAISASRAPVRAFRNTLAPAVLLAAAAASLAAAAPPPGAAAAAPVPPDPFTDEIVRFAPFVINAAADDSPLVTTLDTRAAARPGPAQDGAGIVRAIPGLTVSRKGGAGGEILLRGAAGSRLDILVDHETLLGGCPNRMDPPTAYIFPGDFEAVTVIKGPSTVLHGPGNTAGVVLFKSAVPRFDAPGALADLSAGFGSWGRNDQNLSLAAGAAGFYIKADASRTAADDYRDGDGDPVHSRYDRSGARLALGWAPGENTLVEIHGGLAQGEAAYAHSGMDAAALDRTNAGIRFEKTKIGALVDALEASAFYNFADHVMDGFSLRAPSGMMGTMASNVAQELWGGRAAATLAPAETTRLTLGADFLLGGHNSRSGTTTVSYKTKARVRDASIGTAGLFAEARRDFGEQNRLVAGARLNTWSARDHRPPLTETDGGGGMGGGMGGGGGVTYAGSATGGQKRRETLPAAFIRHELKDALAPGLTLYANLGHTTRAPDYWELFRASGAPASDPDNSVFLAKPEKSTQLDLGAQWKHGPLLLHAALFANTVAGYILIDENRAGSGRVRNIRASALGGEITASHTIGLAAGCQLQLDASLSHVRGRNHTDALPLAQQPPFEARLAAGCVWRGKLSLGATLRLASAQHDYAPNQGGIAGLDLAAPTAGFATLGLNAGWRAAGWLELSAGVDNLFDKTYAEHVNRRGDALPGYPARLRVTEPGRGLWLKARLRF